MGRWAKEKKTDSRYGDGRKIYHWKSIKTDKGIPFPRDAMVVDSVRKSGITFDDFPSEAPVPMFKVSGSADGPVDQVPVYLQLRSSGPRSSIHTEIRMGDTDVDDLIWAKCYWDTMFKTAKCVAYGGLSSCPLEDGTNPLYKPEIQRSTSVVEGKIEQATHQMAFRNAFRFGRREVPSSFKVRAVPTPAQGIEIKIAGEPAPNPTYHNVGFSWEHVQF